MMSNYRKIPKISLRLYISKALFQGLGFGGAYIRRVLYSEGLNVLKIINSYTVYFAIAFFKYAIIDQRGLWACTHLTHYRTKNTKVAKFIKLADTRRSPFSLRVVVPTPLSPRGKGTEAKFSLTFQITFYMNILITG